MIDVPSLIGAVMSCVFCMIILSYSKAIVCNDVM
jgi:hypothetical protein